MTQPRLKCMSLVVKKYVLNSCRQLTKTICQLKTLIPKSKTQEKNLASLTKTKQHKTKMNSNYNSSICKTSNYCMQTISIFRNSKKTSTKFDLTQIKVKTTHLQIIQTKWTATNTKKTKTPKNQKKVSIQVLSSMKKKQNLEICFKVNNKNSSNQMFCIKLTLTNKKKKTIRIIQMIIQMDSIIIKTMIVLCNQTLELFRLLKLL